MSESSLGISDLQASGRPGAVEPEWSAASILERRLGREVVERLVDPLLGGINAGGLDHLSLNVVAPQVARALVGHRSVTRALEAHGAQRPGPADDELPPFETVLHRDAGRPWPHHRCSRGRPRPARSQVEYGLGGVLARTRRRPVRPRYRDGHGSCRRRRAGGARARERPPARRRGPSCRCRARIDPPLERRPRHPRLAVVCDRDTSPWKRLPRAPLRRAAYDRMHLLVLQVATDGRPRRGSHPRLDRSLRRREAVVDGR